MSIKRKEKEIRFKKRGYTLPEILIYVAVLVLISVAGVNTFLSLDSVLLRNSTERAITESAQVALERMVRDIRAASTADVSVPGELTLTSPATTTVFAESGGNVTVTVNGTFLGALTTDNVKVDNLSFYQYQNIGAELETEMVRLELTLTATSTAASTTRIYFTSAVLRGSYE